MIKKKLFFITTILFCLIFVTNNISAALYNSIKIESAEVTFPIPGNERTCEITITYSGQVKQSANIVSKFLIAGTTYYHHPHFLIAPEAINDSTREDYLFKLNTFARDFGRNKSSSRTLDKITIIKTDNVFFQSPPSVVTRRITPCPSYDKIEIMAFVPEHVNISNTATNFDNLFSLKGEQHDLRGQRKKIVNYINRDSTYYNNFDFKIVNVDFKNKGTTTSSTNTTSSVTSSIKSTIPCDDSFISVPGYPYNYKCSDDHKKYQVCINGVIDSEHVFSKNSKLKAILCKGEPIVSAPVIPSLPSEQSSLTSEQSTVLTIENEGYVSDVKFLYNSDWKDVTLIDYPNAYVFENKLQDSKIKINLDSFKEDKVYAIISTSSQKEKIETALKEIYQTGTFSNYTEQTENNPFVIDNKFSGFSKLKYNSNNIILEIKKENTTEDIIFIFMQKTKEDKISLLYTNFYALDQKSQSLFYFCLINKNIVDFYCKGHSCNLDISCLGSKRWDFNPNIFENITFTKVKTSETVPTESTSTEPVTPSTTPTTPTPDTQQTTVSLEKGADGCYTTNPSTLAKIKQENGIGITKQIFSGKRNANSIVFPTNNTGTDDDPSLTIAQIRAVFNRSSLDIPQKVKDASPAFYNLGLLYNIDPVYSLAFFRIEKSLFNQNSGSITSSIISKNDISGVSVCRCGGTKSGAYCSYTTLEQGIEAFYLNLVSGTNSAPNFYKDEKFQSVAIKWNRGNITSQEGITYSNQIITFLSDIYNWAGK